MWGPPTLFMSASFSTTYTTLTETGTTRYLVEFEDTAGSLLFACLVRINGEPSRFLLLAIISSVTSCVPTVTTNQRRFKHQGQTVSFHTLWSMLCITRHNEGTNPRPGFANMEFTLVYIKCPGGRGVWTDTILPIRPYLSFTVFENALEL